MLVGDFSQGVQRTSVRCLQCRLETLLMSSAGASPPDSVAPSSFPAQGRLLGIDFGTVRLGFAVSNQEQTLASPLDNYTRRSLDLDLKHLRLLIQDYRSVGLVIGLPVHMSGREGGTAREARKFGDWIARHISLPITYADERFSSAWAEEQLMGLEMTNKQRKARRDKLAATIILQNFLDHRDAPLQDYTAR